jgi:hypothetical protein
MGTTDETKTQGRDGRRNNGGRRKGAGAKRKVDTRLITTAWMAGELTDDQFAARVLGFADSAIVSLRTAQRWVKKAKDAKIEAEALDTIFGSTRIQ